MSYDATERLTQIKATKGAATLNSFTYCYNRVNPCSSLASNDTDQRWSVTDVNGAKTNYNYDVLNRLTGTSGAATFTYGYDANGNLTNDNGVTQTYNAANELTQSGSTTYSYDLNGNETGNSAGLSLTYNPKNQTTAISGLSMTYTGATQMERVTAGPTNFVYNVLGCGNASTGVASNIAYTRDARGQLTEERLPNGSSYIPYYYLFDGLGSVVGLTDSNGNVVNTYAYEPYGKVASSTGTVANPWMFAGGYRDSQNGLYKFGMRFYDPSVARWTQEDSQGGPNLYLYAGDDPVDNVDPTGASGWDIFNTVLGYAFDCATGVLAMLGTYSLALDYLGVAAAVALSTPWVAGAVVIAGAVAGCGIGVLTGAYGYNIFS